MTMIIDGSNGLTFNNATTQASAGNVFQTVRTTNTTQISTTSTTPVTSGISVAITPKFATSKIMLTVMIAGVYAQSTAQYFTIYRNGTNLVANPSGMTNLYCNVANVLTNTSILYLDSPGSTSTQTYTLYFWVSSGTGYINLSSDYGVTTIILQEISG